MKVTIVCGTAAYCLPNRVAQTDVFDLLGGEGPFFAPTALWFSRRYAGRYHEYIDNLAEERVTRIFVRSIRDGMPTGATVVFLLPGLVGYDPTRMPDGLPLGGDAAHPADTTRENLVRCLKLLAPSQIELVTLGLGEAYGRVLIDLKIKPDAEAQLQLLRDRMDTVAPTTVRQIECRVDAIQGKLHQNFIANSMPVVLNAIAAEQGFTIDRRGLGSQLVERIEKAGIWFDDTIDVPRMKSFAEKAFDSMVRSHFA